MSILPVSFIPVGPAVSFSGTFQRAIDRFSPDALQTALNGVNRVLSVENAPIASLAELTRSDSVARYLEKPSLFREIRKPLGLSVDFIDPVAAAVRARRPPESIENLFRDLAVDLRVLAPYSVFSPEAYQRQWLVYEYGVQEILALSWLPGQKTGIHDHGESQGLDCVIDGEALETPYERAGESWARRAGVPSRHRRGEVAFVAKGAIHRMENPVDSRRNLVSLHAYYPPIQGAASFEESPSSHLSEKRKAFDLKPDNIS